MPYPGARTNPVQREGRNVENSGQLADKKITTECELLHLFPDTTSDISPVQTQPNTVCVSIIACVYRARSAGDGNKFR